MSRGSASNEDQTHYDPIQAPNPFDVTTRQRGFARKVPRDNYRRDYGAGWQRHDLVGPDRVRLGRFARGLVWAGVRAFVQPIKPLCVACNSALPLLLYGRSPYGRRFLALESVTLSDQSRRLHRQSNPLRSAIW